MPDRRMLKRIQHHIEALNSHDQNVSWRAESNLIRYYGSRALEPLIAACSHPNAVVRYRAAWALGFTSDPRAFETLLQLTRDPSGYARYDATLALGNLGDERAIEPLVTLMCTPDPENYIDSAAAMAIVRLGKPAIPALIKLLSHADIHVCEEAAYALGNIKDEAALEPLAHLLTDPDEGIRIAGIEALGLFAAPECLPLIAGCFEDPSEEVRKLADYWYQYVRLALTSTPATGEES